MYKELAHELKKDNPDILKLIMFLANGRPQNFFDKMLNGLFHSPSLGLFLESQDNNFFHTLAQKGILSPILYTIDRHKENILKREDASPDDLYHNLNAVNNNGLTPAHIAVKTDPVALCWLMEFQVALTSNDYSKKILKVYTSNKSINKQSPLEYIFENDEVARNFFVKIIQSGSWEFFNLFKNETLIVQEKFNEHLKHIRDYSKEFGSSIATNAFSMLFKNYWKCILVDEPEFLKVKRLMDSLDPEIEGLVLSVEDLSGLLKSESSSIDEIRTLALEQCAFLYLNKFLLPDEKKYNILKLEHATLERIIGSPKFNTLNFRAIKCYVEGLSDDSTFDDSKNLSTVSPTSDQPEQIEKSPSQDDDQDVTPQSCTEGGVEAVGLIADTVNHTPEFISKTTKSSTELKPVVDIETFAQKIVETVEGKESRAAKLRDALGRYSALHALVYSASNQNLFTNIFKAVVNYFKQRSFEVSLKDVDNFFEEYIKTLSQESLFEVSSKAGSNQHSKSQGVTAYNLACKEENDKIAKLLARRGIDLKLYTEGTNNLFEFAFKYKCRETIQYLLFESGFDIDWSRTLHQAIKYTNIEVVEYYVQSKADVVKNITDKHSNVNENDEYNVFNKALSVLKQLSRSLVRYDDTIDSDNKKLFYQSKINNIKKIPELCKIIELLIREEKLYYGPENAQITGKTYELLSSLKRQTSKISISSDKIVSDIKNLLDCDCKNEVEEAFSSLNNVQLLIFAKYPTHDLNPHQNKMFEKLKLDMIDDATSVATSNPDLSICGDSAYGLDGDGMYDV